MILMIYQEDVFREYVLPKSNNMDYPIVLDKSQFHISKNITLKLEVSEKIWKIHGDDTYRMKMDTSYYDDIILENEKIIFFTTDNDEKFQGIIVDVDESFKVFNKYDISNTEFITIGKAENSIIRYEFKDLISKNHGVIRKRPDGYYIEDYSSNGIFVNYVRIKKENKLKFGDVVNIFGLHIVFLGNVLAVSSNYGNVLISSLRLIDVDNDSDNNEEKIIKKKKDNKFFNRAPRNIPNIHSEEIEIEEPPAPKVSKKKPLLFTIGPSFTMAIPMMLGCFISIYGATSSGRAPGVYMFTGIITAMGSAIIGVIWAIANLKYAKQTENEEEQLRFDSYGNYLIDIASDLKQKYNENAKAMYSMYVSARDCSTYGIHNPNMWNRNSKHSDFLFTRLGTGDIPFQMNIKVPKEKFTLVQDSLKQKPHMLFEEYKILKNVPVGVDLREKQLFGLVGGKHKNGAIQIMYDIVAQLAANNCYTDVKMAFIYEEKSHKEKEKWMFAKWLPHVWSEDKKTRYIAANEYEAKDVLYEIANVIRHRSEEQEQKNKNITPKPYYVLFVSNAALLEGELIKKYIFNPQKEYGITTFIMAESLEKLPNECEEIISYDGVFNGFYNTMDTSGDRQTVTYDEVDVYALTDMAKRLADIKVNELESNADIPSSLDFFEMYGVNSLKEFQVLDRWRKNRTFNTMKALVGKKNGGADCYLDIHEKYHGPHGLIAGTTGSGKSETLQTYMLSLALNFSPDDIGFFIIDFKGGGMANLFSDLPHMIGQISNLSGNQVRRAMISIKSENMRRQRLFSEYGVNNINLYTRLFKNGETQIPIPHLFIIIDEFAELKREEPEFMKELISVAQVGRSLGVHLILATQKPSGTVDDNIWSNSKFRLCLRVQDKQDSNDMLHKPDAAFITQAGRCYMQVGNDEIYELFQSGWSGAIYDENAAEYATNLATMLTNTGKTAIVGSKAKIKKKEQEKKEYYKAIIDIIISIMFEKRITHLGNLDDVKENDLIQAVIMQMNQSGIEYDNTAANVKRLKEMIGLWPDGAIATEKIVDCIMTKALTLNVKLPEMKEKTQLDAVVEYLKKLAIENGYDRNFQLWLPVLSKQIHFNEIVGNNEKLFNGQAWENDNTSWNIEVTVGLYDDPENQAQLPLVINFSETGHLAVCGSVVSGKSTFLQTLIYGLTQKYTPNDVNIYGLDFSSGMLTAFDKMPHVGGMLDENDMEGIAKLFHMLGTIMDERKKKFDGGNYAQYVRAYGIQLPVIFLTIDNYSNFAEKTENAYADMILRIAKEGVGYGIYLLLSSAGFGMAEIPNRIADNMKTIICLEMGDKFKYMDIMHTTKLNVLPEAGIKGRGLASVGGNILEFQTALALEASDDYRRVDLIGKIADKMFKVWDGKKARAIPRIPETPILSEFEDMYEVGELLKTKENLPIAYAQNDASIYSISLKNTYCYMISGKAKTGKTSLLRLIMRMANHMEGEIIVFEKGNSELELQAQECEATYINSDSKLFEYLRDLTPEFKRRNVIKQECKAKGMSNEEIFERMKAETPIFILISDMNAFISSIYKPEMGIGNMNGFVENIIAKGELHNIYFMAVINTDEAAPLSTYAAYKSFTGYKKGVHLGGNVSSQRLYSFQNIPYAEAGKVLKKGIGIVPSEKDESIAEKIVIPLYGK